MTPVLPGELIDRVEVLTRTRSGALDVQAAELRRIERDLHDGTETFIFGSTHAANVYLPRNFAVWRCLA